MGYVSATHQNLKPLNESVKQIREEEAYGLKAAIERRRGAIKERIAKVERNRQLIMDLVGAGYVVQVSDYTQTGEYFRIDLGIGYGTKKAKERIQNSLLEIAKIIGGTLGEPGKDLRNARRREIEIEFQPPKCPGFTVSYVDQLPKEGGKCRIVKEKQRAKVTTRLVCDVEPNNVRRIDA